MRLRYWAIAIVGGAWWLWPSSAARPLDLQAAATSHGFAIIDRTAPLVVETEVSGERPREYEIPKLSDDTRVVGTRGSPALIWKEGKRIAVAPVDRTDRREMFGKRVDRLCSQTASSHLGFGVAWVESDGAIWFVHGPTAGEAYGDRVATLEAAAPYCGIARADQELALLYRNGNRTELVRCGKRCSSPRRVAVDKNHTILGFGCTWHFCLVATRDRDGATTLHWLDEKARTIDKQTLADACKDTGVVVDGEGERFAIGYSNGPRAVVAIADRPGQLRPVWSGSDANTVPALTWRYNVLMIASQRDGKLVWQTMAQ